MIPADAGTTRFGELLREFRTEAGMTQRALALRSGVAERTISDLERGVSHTPQAATFHLLSEALALDDLSRARLLECAGAALAPDPAPAHDSAVLSGRAWTERRRTLWGRDPMLAQVQAALQPGSVVTLTGPGGIGKSRLAQAVAAQIAAAGNEVHGVSLDVLAPGEHPTFAIARAAGAGDAADSVDRLAAALSDRPVTLLVDNADTAPGFGAIAAALAANAPGLRLLVTSRKPLGISSERVIPVPPLIVPPEHGKRSADPLSLASNPSVSLFRERARQAGASVDGFPLDAVADIVIRLDGMPLAIELASAWATMLSPAALLALLDRSGLEVLERPGGYRQRRMDLVIETSAASLTPSARTLLAIAGACTGGFSLAALAHIAAGIGEPDLLEALPEVIHAAFIHETDQPGRFGMLEPLRMYAARLLDLSPLADPAREAHARWAASLARRIADDAFGPAMRRALAAEEADRANLLAAFRWAIASNRPGLAAAIGVPLFRIWEAAFVNIELHDAFDALCAQSAAIEDPGDRAMVLFCAAYNMNLVGKIPAAQRRIAQLRAEMAGNEVAIGLANLAESIVGMTDPAMLLHLMGESVILLERARHPLAWAARLRLGATMQVAGDPEGGIELLREVLAGMEQAGNLFDPPVPMLQLGISLVDLGRIDEARAVYRQMIDFCQRHRFDHALFRAFMGLAEAAMLSPSPQTARVGVTLFGAAEAMSVRSGVPQVRWWQLRLEAARARAEALLGEKPVVWLVAEGHSIPPAEAARLALGR
jgi:predicted ATPase/transcriptional regulator with XRE-family HTH domain